MPFPVPLSSPQQTTLRSSGYWSRNLVALCDNAVVFRAQASQSITDMPFITFTWDNADIGDYESVWEGMVAYISETTSIRDAKYRGRVRLAPTSTHFHIDLNATLLNEGDYIIVVRDCDIFARIRTDTLVDSSITYRPLAPQTKGLPNTVLLYDADNDGQVTFTPVQEGIAVDVDATTVDTWAWDISGDATSSIDDPTLEHPTFTFEAGYHYLVRVTYEDDNGTENYQLMHVYAITRPFSAPVVQPIVAGSVSSTIEDGWTASLTAYADVSTLIDRTHAVVFHVEHFGDDSSTPIFDNILMNGRIRSDSIQTQGSAEAGRVQQVTFQVEGITAYLRRLRIPNDIVRPVSSPNEWGEIKKPNPYRMAVYALWVYSTLTNIGSFGVEEGEFADWEIGAEPRGIDGGSALDVLASLLDPIRAGVNYAPSGELFLAIDTNYRTDRSGVPLIATLGLPDLTEYNVARDSSRTYAQVIAYGGSYNSAANTFVLYTASAPSIVYGDGGDTLEITREILQADSTPTEAAEELGGRASNHYAHENPHPLLNGALFDSYAGVMIPTNYQRWAFVLPASSNTLGVAYTATGYWQLQGISLTLNPDGTIGVSPDLPAETAFDDAQIIADQLPNALSDMNPVLPVLANDYLFPTDPLENYPTDTPALDDLQPVDPFSGMVAYSPFPPDVAAEAALNQGTANCKTLAVNYRWASNVTSSWVTLPDEPYRMTLDGWAAIGTDPDVVTFDDGGVPYTIVEGTIDPDGMSGNCLLSVYTVLPPSPPFDNVSQKEARISVAAGSKPLSISWYAQTVDINPYFLFVYLYNGDTELAVYQTGEIGNPTAGWELESFTLPSNELTDVDRIELRWWGGWGNAPGPDVRYVKIDNVAITTALSTVYGDPLYQWGLDSEGKPINVTLHPPGQGLFIDNTQYTPVPAAPFPPFNPSHRYGNLPYTGTGNPLNARIVLSNNALAQNVYENITLCRQAT